MASRSSRSVLPHCRHRDERRGLAWQGRGGSGYAANYFAAVISPGPGEERHQHDAVRRMSDDPRYGRRTRGGDSGGRRSRRHTRLHQGCNTLQWTGSGLGFVRSTAVFFTALPATATGNPVAIAAAVFSGMGALGRSRYRRLLCTMMPISIARIVIAVLLVVVWIVVVAAGYRWLRPRGQVIGRRYLAVAVPTGAVVAAAAIVLLLAGSPWLAGSAIVLVL